jgi:hypothetical protein
MEKMRFCAKSIPFRKVHHIDAPVEVFPVESL